jgi:uncharacterized protein
MVRIQRFTRRHPVGSLVGLAIGLELLLIPAFLLTGADAALDRALDAADLEFNTDLVSAVKLVLREPSAWFAVALALLQVASPDLALVGVSRLARAPEWLRDVRSRFRLWHGAIGRRRGLRVWASTIVLFTVFNVTSGVLHRQRFGAGEFAWSVQPLTVSFVLSFCAAMFLDAGAVFEENAWRGFALPILQERRGPLIGTVILGLWWTLWHAPVKFDLFLDHGFASGTAVLGVLTVKFVALSIVMTYFSNRAGISTVLAIVMHGLSNDSVRIGGLVEPASLTSELWTEINLGAPMIVVAIALVLLTRGDLGYRHVQRIAATTRAPDALAL